MLPADFTLHAVGHPGELLLSLCLTLTHCTSSMHTMACDMCWGPAGSMWQACMVCWLTLSEMSHSCFVTCVSLLASSMLSASDSLQYSSETWLYEVVYSQCSVL